MGDLDRRLKRRCVAIERQQAALPECVEDRRQGHRVEFEARKIRQRQPPARLRCAHAELHEVQEHLHRHLLLVAAQAGIDRFSASGQHASNPAEHAIPIEGQCRAVPLIEELGEGELEQRKRPRPVPRIGDQRGEEWLLDVDATPFGRTDDHRLQLVGRHRERVLDARGEDPGEIGMEQRAIVVVGTKRQ